jgi:trans-2,3-dihydro-3-hydroxyanthranilate isomerase
VPFLFVPLRTLRAVEHVKLRIDIWERILKDFEANKVFVFTHAAVTPQGTVHSRMFAPSLGIKEDAATGGASGPLGAYLIQHNIITDNPARIVSEQGFEMGRPSFIHIGIERSGSQFTGVTVGGQCVYMGSGVLQL